MPIKLNRCPTHPGAILREDTLREIGLSVNEMADILGISRRKLSDIVNERASVTPDIAHRLGRALGMLPDIWLRMQQAVDLYKAKLEHEAEYRRIECVAA